MLDSFKTVLSTILEVVRMLKAFFADLTDELGIELKKDEE